MRGEFGGAARGLTEPIRMPVAVNADSLDGWFLAVFDDAELAQMLVYAGANVKATTRLGANTPLIIAARNGNAAVVQALLKAGADAKAGTSTGTTPLMLASASGSVDAVKALLAAGAKVGFPPRPPPARASIAAARFSRANGLIFHAFKSRESLSA